ncbi:hypothetical protein B296_00022397 [Ensete ventricosum]|uniref:Uncharacterized protein n=1 Tax=Ensete ventricosum TaxID=4639 RepID=A0A427A2W3_ENSVE|nr:hypothetical protein B296_00022397 [Ensete ventricosum]
MTPNPTTFSKKRTKHEQDKNGRQRNQGRLTSRYLRWKRRTDEGTERSDGGEREREDKDAEGAVSASAFALLCAAFALLCLASATDSRRVGERRIGIMGLGSERHKEAWWHVDGNPFPWGPRGVDGSDTLATTVALSMSRATGMCVRNDGGLTMEESGEAEIGEARGKGEEEFDCHIVSTMVGVRERTKWDAIGTKMPKRRKRDQETISYLASN